ncbi:MAG: DNA polymerase III subunit gamma/tau, partial [Tepidiformaceae bacterium]
TTLRNALASGQIAHAYLFSGPRGTGKTTTARILARAVNCANLKGGDPCNECESCLAIGEGRALDLIEMDAASNRGIDDIRELREKIAFAPSDLKVKVYLLDEVHMLTQGAFNALLKTLEEPPPHAIFILATTELHEVPPTVQSRCQRHDFHRVNNDALVGRLERICEGEGFKVPREGLTMMAIQSRGGARDAITLLEQVTSRYGNSPSTDDVLDALGLVQDERTEKLARAILQKDLATALDVAREISDDGIDIARFTRSVIDALRAILPQVLRGRVEDEGQYQALAQDALSAGVRPAEIANAVSELAKADFRLDPGSPIPLEVACAAATMGPQAAQVVVAADAGAPTTRSQSRPAQTQRAAGGPPGPGNAGGGRPALELTREQRFMRDLYRQCSVANYRLGAHLNGSCEVLAVGDGVLELGFYHALSMEKIDSEGRTMVEQQAEALLGEKVELRVKLVERQQQSKAPASKGGHLAKVAETLGGVPVGKE